MSREKAQERSTDSCLLGDIFAMLPGWAAILLVDPWTATVAGLPTAVVMIAIRRILWPRRPVVSRVVVAVLMPVVAVFASAAFALGSLGLFGGVLISAALLALVESWNRRYGRTFLGRFPVLTGVVFLLGFAGFAALTLSTGMVKYPTEEFVKSLAAAKEGPEWSPEAKGQALSLAYRVVGDGDMEEEQLDELVSSMAGETKALGSMTVEAGVFVTLFDKDGWTARGMSDARDPVLAVAQAAYRAAASDGARQRSMQKRETDWASARTDTFIKIDVAGWDKAVTKRYGVLWLGELARGADSSLKKLEPLEELLNLALEVEAGVDGLILSREGGKTAVMLPDEPVTGGWLSPRQRSGPKKIRKMLQLAWKRNTGEELDFDEPGLSVRRFRTSSFGSSGPGAKVRSYYRGNVLLEGDLTREGLVERIAMASDWLSRRVRANGRFEYEMVPPYKGSTGAYNLPRHAGSAFGLLAIYNESRGEEGLEAAGNRALAAALDAIDYMAANMRSPDPEKKPDLRCFIDEKGRAASGSTALGALAVAELPDHEKVEDERLAERLEAMPVDSWLNGMSECMLTMIDQEGAVFRTYKESVRNDFVDKEPLYYPGEVAFALVHSYKKTGNEKYLEGARRIADRQLRRHETVLMFDFPWPGDHWIMQALGELSELDLEHSEDYARLAVLMGKGYVREQYPPQDFKYPDYRGAYRRIVDVPRTTRAGSRGEALAGSVRAARKLGVDPSAFEHALIAGARHLAEQQFVEANSFFVPRSWDVEGAIRMGLVDNHVRIDNNQHAMVGMLNGLKAMDGDWD